MTDDLIHKSFPSQGVEKRAHEGSQSQSPRDANQPVDLSRKKPSDAGESMNKMYNPPPEDNFMNKMMDPFK